MRVLILHLEAQYFAGAEMMLHYFVSSWPGDASELVLGLVSDGELARRLPAHFRRCLFPSNQRFQIRGLWRQWERAVRACAEHQIDLIHGWAARDWEISSLAAAWRRIPAIGTLHDHPAARFIRPRRRRLMRWSARWGLRQVICVSEAVRQACEAEGYRASQLAVVHNGLPLGDTASAVPAGEVVRLGFLGAFTERKGLRDLFELCDRLEGLTTRPWELHLAGDCPDAASRQFWERLLPTYSSRSWWPKVHRHGWVREPAVFLKSIDLLLCPSSEFDPFPTVLLEAAAAARPAIATAVGGVPEIIEPGRTGWLFRAGAWEEGARLMAELVERPSALATAGEAARCHFVERFQAARMVRQYREFYAGHRHSGRRG